MMMEKRIIDEHGGHFEWGSPFWQYERSGDDIRTRTQKPNGKFTRWTRWRREPKIEDTSAVTGTVVLRRWAP